MGSSGSTWAQPQVPGRPSTCSARATGGPSAEPTWSWPSWRRTAGRTPRPCWTAWRSSPGPGSPTAARRSRRWTSTPCWPASPRSRWSTSSRTPTSPDRGTPSAGRTSRSCWPRASTSSPTSTSSTWSPSTTSSRRSPACRSGKPSRTPWSARADQVELVDITPEALRRRMAHGNIYPPEKIDAALTNYFRTGNLTALRELALLWLADKVDEGLQRYRAEHGISGTWEARERVVVALTGGPEGETLIRRGARIAARSTGGDLLAVHVTRSDGLTGADPAALAEQRRLVESLGGTYHQVIGDDIPEALLSFARAENATQLVLGASRRSWLSSVLTGPGFGARTIRGSGDIDVHIVTHAQMGRGRGLPRARRRADPAPPADGLPARRGALPAADPGPGRAPRPAQPDQRCAGLPGRGHRGRPGGRVRAGDPGRHRRIAAAQLLLHPAAAPLDDRRGQQRAGPGRVRGGGAAGQLGGGPGRPADPAGGPGQRRVRAAGHHRRQRAARPAGRWRPCSTGSARRFGMESVTLLECRDQSQARRPTRPDRRLGRGGALR